MSPVSSRKVSDPGVRVQVPFTSSDTCTSAGAWYWANHPTRRSPWATGLVSVTVSGDAPANAVPWMKVRVVDFCAAACDEGAMPPALPRLGASLPLPPDLTMCRRVAERAEALGYESIWIADTGAGPDAFVVGATAALATRRVRIGTAVVPIYTR